MASHAVVPAWTSNMNDQTLGPPVVWIKEPQMLLQRQTDEMLPQRLVTHGQECFLVSVSEHYYY